jgi:hypothetical protein
MVQASHGGRAAARARATLADDRRARGRGRVGRGPRPRGQGQRRRPRAGGDVRLARCATPPPRASLAIERAGHGRLARAGAQAGAGPRARHARAPRPARVEAAPSGGRAARRRRRGRGGVADRRGGRPLAERGRPVLPALRPRAARGRDRGVAPRDAPLARGPRGHGVPRHGELRLHRAALRRAGGARHRRVGGAVRPDGGVTDRWRAAALRRALVPWLSASASLRGASGRPSHAKGDTPSVEAWREHPRHVGARSSATRRLLRGEEPTSSVCKEEAGDWPALGRARSTSRWPAEGRAWTRCRSGAGRRCGGEAACEGRAPPHRRWLRRPYVRPEGRRERRRRGESPVGPAPRVQVSTSRDRTIAPRAPQEPGAAAHFGRIFLETGPGPRAYRYVFGVAPGSAQRRADRELSRTHTSR